MDTAKASQGWFSCGPLVKNSSCKGFSQAFNELSVVSCKYGKHVSPVNPSIAWGACGQLRISGYLLLQGLGAAHLESRVAGGSWGVSFQPHCPPALWHGQKHTAWLPRSQSVWHGAPGACGFLMSRTDADRQESPWRSQSVLGLYTVGSPVW